MATTQQILADYAAIDYTPPYALAGQPTATLPAAPDPTLVAAYQPLTNDAVISAIEGETYTLVTVDAVIREFQGAFGTIPDQAGAAFWTHAIDNGTASSATLSIAFALSPQFATLSVVRPPLRRPTRLSSRRSTKTSSSVPLMRQVSPSGLARA